MMQPEVLLRLSLVLPCGLLVACAKPSPTPAPVAATTEATEATEPLAETNTEPSDELPVVDRELLVWRVSKGDAVSHLMGTCHLPIPLPDLLPDPTPLQTARVAVVEVDMAQLDPVEAMQAIWTDTSQAERIGRARFAELSRTLGPEMPAPLVDRMVDWSIVSLLAIGGITPELAAAPSQPAAQGPVPVVDQAVMQLAREAGVALRPVETLGDQVAMMGELGLDITDEATDADAEAAQDVLSAMAKLCLRGDLGVEPMLESSYDPMNHALLEARNEAWYPTIREELAAGDTFVAVGAGHLLGSTGLLARAEADGYELQRLSGTVRQHPLPQPGSATEAAPSEALLPEDAVDVVADNLVPLLCAEGEVIRTCLQPDPDACAARVHADLALCVDQLVWDEESLQQLAAPDQAQKLVGCGLAGLLGEALVHDRVGSDPTCQSLVPPTPSGP